MLEVFYGNVTPEQAERLGNAAGTIDGEAHIPGSAEPWISRLVADFVIATGARTVLETGTFMGGTSVWIYYALVRLGGGRFHIVEIDNDRMSETKLHLLRAFQSDESVTLYPRTGDVLDYLRRTTDRFDLAWVDDNHEKKHVEQELTLLLPLMNPGGVILGHDVWGSCDLQEVFTKFGGFSVNLPRLGGAGGIGIIQVPHPGSLGPWIPGDSQTL